MSQNDEKTMIDPGAGPSKDGAKMKLGPYETTEVLGRGGMAVVYKGTQQSLGRVVAIKVLPKEFSRDRQFVGRFHREAESVAKLNHPNIIQIIDKGEDKGTCYFVMEYVKGQSLSAKLANKGVTLKELVEIGVQVCGALHYAHEQGVVHRDIKPANILLDDTTGVAKVADFGIAQLAEKSTAIGTLTGDHMAMGTLDYMAPEQKRDAKNVDRRADVFSVGVMLYEMATGRVPMGLFDPPSRLNKDIPKEFDSIVMRCLRDKPAERYQTCQELSSALLTLPQNPSTMIRMITSVKSGVTNIGTQIGKRNPRYVAAVLLLLGALGAGTWAAWKYGINRRGDGGGGSTADSGGNSGGNSNGGTNGNGGGTSTKPPDDTAAKADKEYRDALKAAGVLVVDGKFKEALDAYDRLLEKATDAQRAEIMDGVREAKLAQESALADDFTKRLQAARVPPDKADAAAVKALEDLLDSARQKRVRNDVLTEISGELERTRDAQKDNDEKAKAAAAENARRSKFEDAMRKAEESLAAGDLEAAERSLAQASQCPPKGPEEETSYATARNAYESKRAAMRTADQNEADLKKILEAISISAKAGKFTNARSLLVDAEGKAKAMGGDAPARVKEAAASVEAEEKRQNYEAKLAEARKHEEADPEVAAKLYKEAADMAPGATEKSAALAKAGILDRKVAELRAEKEYTEHMTAAEAAFADRQWKEAEKEAALALRARPGDAKAMSLVDRARAEAAARPPEKKEVTFTFKGVATWRGLDACSIGSNSKGAVFIVDYKSQKLHELDPDPKLKRSIDLKFKGPYKICFDRKDHLFIATWDTWVVHEVDLESGASLRSFWGVGKGDDKCDFLADLAASPAADEIFILDTNMFRFSRVGTDGTLKGNSGVRYAKDDREPSFWKAAFITVDAEGRAYTCDQALKSIKRFKPDGTFEKVFLTAPNLVPGPIVAARNRIYVADLAQYKVLVYTPEGQLLGSFGGRGAAAQCLNSPTGITVDRDGRVFVADKRERVVVYEEDK